MESTRTSHLPVSTMRVREGRLEQKYHTYVHEVQIPDTTPIARLPYQLALSRATRERRESDERATRERRESDCNSCGVRLEIPVPRLIISR